VTHSATGSRVFGLWALRVRERIVDLGSGPVRDGHIATGTFALPAREGSANRVRLPPLPRDASDVARCTSTNDPEGASCRQPGQHQRTPLACASD
jgi:hypothetical protein